ncbi:MAG: hypothetical protein EOO89_11320 [Pedobacter sp.]|nr:MAG: hypothetical protein EOO89_11320 [Pedobacter sp.]
MHHALYMQRCLDLAQQGSGAVSPNPMVGCVIVHDEKIIGEGYHQQFGTAHAEVNAVNAVIEKYPDAPELLKGSTVYVNLEPCAHFGKTPPCADLLVKYVLIVAGVSMVNLIWFRSTSRAFPFSFFWCLKFLNLDAGILGSDPSLHNITVKIKDRSETSRVLDLASLSAFPKLKYVYLMTGPTVSVRELQSMIRNNDPKIAVFYNSVTTK